MTTSYFRQSFLVDTLDMDQVVEKTEHILTEGHKLILHERGVLEVIPRDYNEDTKNLVVSCGIHGDETAPMEIVDKIISDITSGFQPVNERCLFIVAHPEATLKHVRFIDENMNRLFSNKDHDESTETKIAAHLCELVAQFYEGTQKHTRWHMDLHCAIRLSKHYSFAVSPRVRHKVRSRALMSFLESAHVEAILLSNAPSGTFTWFSAEEFAAQAITIELGRVAPFGENDLDKLVAFDLSLRDLIARSDSEHLPKRARMYRVSRTLVRLHEDFDFIFDDDVQNFTSFKHGEVFGHDGDKPLMAKNEDEAIVFPNRHVEVGQRAALMVCPVKVRFENDELVYD